MFANDIDIVAVLDVPHLESWFTELSATFLTDLDQAREPLAIGGSFNLIHSTTYLKVDVSVSYTHLTLPTNREV